MARSKRRTAGISTEWLRGRLGKAKDAKITAPAFFPAPPPPGGGGGGPAPPPIDDSINIAR